MSAARALLCLSLSLPVAACSTTPDDDPARRYEPSERLDHDNVVDYSGGLTQLMLPEPPRSGFRIIAPARTLAPGEEHVYCLAWPYPAIRNQVIHAGRLYTTPGLHHSNVVSQPVDPKLGPQPYPHCRTDGYHPFDDIPRVIPDVLFGNTTQIVGQETLAFPEGMGFWVDTTREIVTSMHILNPSDRPQRVEIAYDFFTMPESALSDEVAPFYMQINDFLIPPHTRKTIGSTCDVYGGRVASMMVHTHKLAEASRVELVRGAEAPAMLYKSGTYGAESEIRVYSPLLELTSLDSLRYSCDFNNTTDHNVVFGIGQNEMCILLGYITPPDRQVIGLTTYEDQPCQSVNVGAFRKPHP